MSNQISTTPQYIGMVQQTSVDFYEANNSLFESFQDFLDELGTCIELEKAKSSEGIAQSISNVYIELNNSKLDNYNEQFQLYFIEKYQSLVTSVKDFIADSLGTGNVYLIAFSDDIGNIVNQTSIVDNSTSPFFDTYDTSFNYPNALPASLYNKVSQTQLDNNIRLSVYTDALMKTNLAGLQSATDVNVAKTAHGDNLVNDSLYIDRLFLLKDPVNAKIKTLLKNMADFINFFKEVNWQDRDVERVSVDLAYTTTIEGVSTTLDMLKNKIDAGSSDVESDLDDAYDPNAA
jgi:hypothetical protein